MEWVKLSDVLAEAEAGVIEVGRAREIQDYLEQDISSCQRQIGFFQRMISFNDQDRDFLAGSIDWQRSRIRQNSQIIDLLESALAPADSKA